MSDEKIEPTQRRTRRRPRPRPVVLQDEIHDLQDLLEQVKEKPEDDPTLSALLDKLEGVGRTCIRLATLLKAERQLAAEHSAGKSLAEASVRVLEAMEREAQEARGSRQGSGEPGPP
jgi:hypothetical protein